MELLHEEKVCCPYCNEVIVILVDLEDLGQEYIEDCRVCCQPISVQVTTNIKDELMVIIYNENEA
ncbi:MAG: CPXCG motif-containing cysteine-rich protein [Aliivibrio sp.]|nr:CPXCG motif-containing cysteine-rich protein [Aliivibrio sp.]